VFPAADNALEGRTLDKDQALADWRRGNRAAHPDVLSVYLTLSLPLFSIPAARFDAVIQGLTNTSDLISALDSVSSDWIMDLLVRIIPYIGPADVQSSADRLTAFMALYPRLPDRRKTPNDVGPIAVLDQLVKQCVLEAPSKQRLLVVLEVLGRRASFSARFRLLRIICEDSIPGVARDDPGVRAALSDAVKSFHEADIESILEEADLLWIFHWIAELNLPQDLGFDDRLNDSGLRAAIIRNALHEVETREDEIGSPEIRYILDYEALLLLLGGEGGLSESTRTIREDAIDHDESLDDRTQMALSVVDRYLQGYRPFPVAIERTSPVASPSQQFVYWDQGPDGPDLVLRSAVAFSVSPDITNALAVDDAFRANFVEAAKGGSSGAALEVIADRAQLAQPAWILDPATQPNDSHVCIALATLENEESKAVQCRVGVSFYNSGLQGVRVWVDWCFWLTPLLDLAPGNARLKLLDVFDQLSCGLRDCAISIPTSVLRLVLGQSPKRDVAEIHVLVPQRPTDPSQPRNVGTALILPELSKSARPLPQEGEFATTGKAPLDDAKSVGIVVRWGVTDMLRRWGVVNPDAALPAIQN
jgi:hypothetical protein